MSEILLIRHAQSYANKRDYTAFGNVDSPLTEKGIGQTEALNRLLKEEFGVIPEEYEQPVAASEYTRTQQTAEYTGFKKWHILPLINESDVDRDIMSGVDVIKRHKAERWAPEETALRANILIDRIKSGDLEYGIYFTHGMFIASFLLQCEVKLLEVAHPFDEKRGYVPLQTAVVKAQI